MNNLSLDEAQRYCVFQSGDNWFGFPSLDLRSVIPRPETNRLPVSDPILQGVSHIQNEFLPVVSLRSLLNVQYEKTDAETQMMILAAPQSSLGLLIDRAVGLADLELSYSTNSVQDDDTWSRIIVGSATYSNQVLQVLDSDAIYRYAHHLLERYWSDVARPDVNVCRY